MRSGVHPSSGRTRLKTSISYPEYCPGGWPRHETTGGQQGGGLCEQMCAHSGGAVQQLFAAGAGWRTAVQQLDGRTEACRQEWRSRVDGQRVGSVHGTVTVTLTWRVVRGANIHFAPGKEVWQRRWRRWGGARPCWLWALRSIRDSAGMKDQQSGDILQKVSSHSKRQTRSEGHRQ